MKKQNNHISSHRWRLSVSFLLILCILMSGMPLISVMAESERLTVKSEEVAVGEPIYVSAIGSGKDWVGIYYPSDEHSIRWVYVADIGSGVTFDMWGDSQDNGSSPVSLPVGEYVIRLMPNDSSNVADAVAEKTIRVVETKSDEPQPGLTAEFWQFIGKANRSNVYGDIIGTNTNRGPHVSFDDTQRFDSSIEQLKFVSVIDHSEDGLTDIHGRPFARDGYLIHWIGTVTAATSGTYTFIGNKLDNGFVAFVEQNGIMEKKFEYWASNHWFDSGNDYLYSNQGSFTLEAGVATPIDMWYLEVDGGEALEVRVSTVENGGSENARTFADAGLSLNLHEDVWYTNLTDNHEDLKSVFPTWGVNADGEEQTDSNGCPAWHEKNHTYNATIEAIKAKMMKVGTCVVPNFESESHNFGYRFGAYMEDSLIEYNGYMTPSVTGEYEFGTRKVDNCLMVEITDEDTGITTRVYEFWAKGIWNDSDTTYSDVKVNLEEGKSYKIHAVFLEINGGQAIETRVKIDGEEKTMANSGLTFTVTKPQGVVLPTNVSFFERGAANWHYITSGDDNTFQIRDLSWATDASVYGAWETHMGEMSKDNVWTTDDDGTMHQTLWAVAEFDVESLKDLKGYSLATSVSWDDNVRIYINGKLVFVDNGWSNGAPIKKLADVAVDYLVEGKNTVAVKLVQGWGGASFDMSLYATRSAMSEEAQANTYVTIATPQELLDYVAVANAAGNDNKNHIVNIVADLDMTGCDWTPIDRYIGKIYGNGHTISNITYTAVVDATGANEGLNVGILVNNLANNNANGKITDLTVDHCTLTVQAKEGNNKNQQVMAGIVAGMVDRGFVENVVVSNCVIDGNPSNAGGIAGVGCWNADQKGYHLENCAVINTQIGATQVGGGIVAFLRGGDKACFGDVKVTGVNFTSAVTGELFGATWGWGESHSVGNTEFSGNTNNVILKLNGRNYSFFVQTRPGEEEGTTDVRIVAVVKEEWLMKAGKAELTIRFTDGTTTKSTTQIPKTFYQNIKAVEGDTEVTYVAEEGAVIVGWVVTGVPADFVNGLSVQMKTNFSVGNEGVLEEIEWGN